jgi:tRNA-dihydrouridine synthase B
MIGRAAQGRPWVFKEILHFLETGESLLPPSVKDVHKSLISHLQDHHRFYGPQTGVRTARKHLQWYLTPIIGLRHPFMNRLMIIENPDEQLDKTEHFFEQLGCAFERLPQNLPHDRSYFLN